MSPSPKRGESLIELSERFKTQEDCLSFLENLRWPNGPVCPKCGHERAYRNEARRLWECASCRYQYSVTAGTIFHKTRLPLRKWILAASLICNAKKGISAKQVERDLRVTYKTAWYLMHRIRKAMRAPGILDKFKGICEVDEKLVGGKLKGKGRGPRMDNKTTVLGVRERGGAVRASVAEDRKAKTVCKFVRDNVAEHAEMLCADEHAGYNGLKHGFNPHRVNHSKKEYARGNVHVNSIESFWSLLERAYVGTFHKLSKKWLPAYVDEFAFRFSHTRCSNGVGLWKTLLSNGLRHSQESEG